MLYCLQLVSKAMQHKPCVKRKMFRWQGIHFRSCCANPVFLETTFRTLKQMFEDVIFTLRICVCVTLIQGF